MADYHPLDVRYKGPSTAWRGSARKRKDAAPVPISRDGSPAGPWGVSPDRPAPVARPLRRLWHLAAAPALRIVLALALYLALMQGSGIIGLDAALMKTSGF